MSEVGPGTARVLYVDDDTEWRERVGASLGRADGFTVVTEPGGHEALGRLDRETVDCVLSAHDLPDMDGLAFLEAVRDRYPDLPFVLLPDDGSERVASAAISAGVTEYLAKGDATERGVLTEHVTRAITGQGRGSRERERELERFETVVQAVGDPVYALDADGRFTFVNEAFEPMTGYDTDELVGEHIGTILTDEDLREGREYIGELVADDDKRAVKYEIEVVTADGDHIPSELHLALLPGEEGEFRGTAGIIRDIAERKERERRLEEFASVVSHDLRGPLNVVLGQAQIARQTSDLEHLETIFGAAKRMEKLIDDLLTLARQGEIVGDSSEVDLATVVEGAWNGIETADATLENRAEGTVDADVERLQELFENLIRNSVEHGGPTVTVTVGTFEDGFYVADDGPGIPDDRRETVFERGFTTREEGTGFGLAIVERIAEAHGWTVDVVESASGGARFEFRDGE